MNAKKITIWLLIFSALLALLLGWLDYETTSLKQLLTAPGNLIALIIYTILFTAIAWLVIGIIIFAKRLVSKINNKSS